MPTVTVKVGAEMKTQLKTPNVQGWAVYFNSAGTTPVWTQLTDSGATLNLPDQQGLKVYFLLQGMAPGVESVDTQIQTESQITPTGTLSSADVLNYRYDSFEVTFTPAPADAGNLTDINGFGIPMEIDVVYDDGTPGTRGYSIPGGGVASSGTIWNELVSAGGSGSIQYFASATSGLTVPRMAISPATAISENISGTNYHTSNWNNYITNLQSSTAVSAGSGGAAGAEQIQITGYFNGAPDGNNVWHNAGFYSYRVTFTGGNFVLTPDAASQIKGAITISPADLANSIYMTLGNATVTGLANPNGIAGSTTTLTMNTGSNNEWGTVLRDFLAGFTAGYWGSTATSQNAQVSGSIILNKEWNQDPTYAFGGAITSGTGSVTPVSYVSYDEYAKVFFNYTNSYGNGYSDFLTRAYNVGPLVNVTQSPTGSPTSSITVTLFGDSDTPTGYTSQTIANYIAPTGGAYLVPAGVNTSGIQTTLNFNVGQTRLIEGTPIQIILKGANPAADVALPTISSFNNYKVVSNGSGGYTTTTYGNLVSGVVNLLDLPVTAATSGTGVNWYQIVVGTGAAAKTFNFYLTVDSAGNILNPNYTSQGGSIAIDGLAAITGTGTGQYVTTGGMTISFFQGGTNTLDPSLLTTISGTLLPWVPLVGMRPGYTSSDGAPFLQSYEVWSAQSSGTTTPQTVYNGGLVFGWNGSDQAALQQQTAASNFYVASYTNKIFGSSYAKLTFSALGGSTLPSEIVSNGGYLVAQADVDGNWATSVPVSFTNGAYTVQMQEFADSGLTSALNNASLVQSFTVAQGTAISTYNLSLESGTSAGLVIASGGGLTVNGGTASATMISAGGIEYVASGIDRGAIVLGQHQVWSGATATSMTIASGGSGYVYGTTSAVAVNGGGFQYVGGQAHQSIASATTVNSGGNQYVFGSGFASGTTVLSGGKQVVGGATSSGGGGFAMNSLINAGGQLLVSAGGSAGSSYYVTSTVGSTTVTMTYLSGSATIAGGIGYVYSGGVTLGTLMQGSGGVLNAYANGSAASTTIQSGTVQYAYLSGSSLAATVQSGGFEVVWGSGSVASGATVQSDGYEYIYDRAQATSTTIQSGGRQFVWDSGTIASNSLIQFGGLMQVHNGGSALNTTILGGLQVVWSGGTASNTTVNDFTSSGTSSSTLFNGSQHIGATGSAFATTVNSGGFQYNYGDAVGTIVNSAGSAITYSGGTTTSAQINAGGTYHVIAGGSASDLAVTGTGANAFVWSGGSLQGATISGGFLEVLSGGVASGSINFVTAGGTVKFDDSDSINPLLSISGYGYQSGAMIFGDIGFTSGATSTTWNQSASSGGVLTITSGALQASINLFGNYVAGDFTLASDGAAGTLITDTSPPTEPFSLLAHPHA